MFGKLFRSDAPVDWQSINDIEPLIRARKAQTSKLSLRESAPIVVIDDQAFEPAANLRNNHYNINHMSDVQNINQVMSYPIVLCDLQGVAGQLHASLQGAHVIKEIKEHYPQKIVIAYTGGARTSQMARAAQQYADTFLKKDASLDEWIEALDSAIEKVTDPIHMWKQFRKRLLDTGVTPVQLVQLEDAYVRGLNGGKDAVEVNIASVSDRLGLAQDVRVVVQSFIASIIFKLFLG